MSQVLEHHDNHGKTTAAWTGVFICLAGSLVAAIGVAMSQSFIMWIGLAIFALGGIVGWLMGRASRGRATPHTPVDSHHKPA